MIHFVVCIRENVTNQYRDLSSANRDTIKSHYDKVVADLKRGLAPLKNAMEANRYSCVMELALVCRL
jgi:hypothetical protein